MEVRNFLTSMDNLITQIYKTPKTVFTIKYLAVLWNETNPDHLKAKTSYYVKTGALKRLTRGIFARDKNYNPKELASNIYTPSYISFETALREAGIIFQYYETIFIASRFSKKTKINGHNFVHRKMKEEVLYNPDGIINNGIWSIAAPERAFLDMIYISPNYYFDNLHGIHWDTCFEMVKIYNNRELIKRLNSYHKDYAE